MPNSAKKGSLFVASLLLFVSTTGMYAATKSASPVPFQTECSVDTGSGGGAQCIFKVPKGKRLVIEMFSAELELDVGDRPIALSLNAIANGNGVNHWFFANFSVSDPSLGIDFLTVSQPTRIYADPGSSILITLATHSAPLHVEDFSISGHLEEP